MPCPFLWLLRPISLIVDSNVNECLMHKTKLFYDCKIFSAKSQWSTNDWIVFSLPTLLQRSIVLSTCVFKWMKKLWLQGLKNLFKFTTSDKLSTVKYSQYKVTFSTASSGKASSRHGMTNNLVPSLFHPTSVASHYTATDFCQNQELSHSRDQINRLLATAARSQTEVSRFSAKLWSFKEICIGMLSMAWSTSSQIPFLSFHSNQD